MFEDGVKHRARTLHEPFNMRVDFAVNVRKEEQLLVSLDHETGEMHGTEVILHFREIGHQRGQLFGERLDASGYYPHNREVNGEMILNISLLLSDFAHRGFLLWGPKWSAGVSPRAGNTIASCLV